MARHIWLAKGAGFSTQTLNRAVKTLDWCMTFKMDFDRSCRLIGYVVESLQQKGGLSVRGVVQGTLLSNHRYARGHNRDNYLKAGKALLSALAPRCGLMDGTPAEVVWDALQDGTVKEVVA